VAVAAVAVLPEEPFPDKADAFASAAASVGTLCNTGGKTGGLALAPGVGWGNGRRPAVTGVCGA